MELKEGIIIKTINYKENSKLVYMVCEDGLNSLEAKGASKVNSHTHLYSNLLTNIAFSSKSHFLHSAKVLNNYTRIKSNLNKLNLVMNILELTYASIEHITNFKVFYDFLKSILNLMEEENNDEFYYSIFHIKLLYLLGIQPILNKCVKCEAKENLLGFVLSDGGMKCSTCLTPSDVLISDKSFLETIYKMYYLKLDVLKENQFDFDFNKLKGFIDDYYREFLSYSSKSDKIFKQINKKINNNIDN